MLLYSICEWNSKVILSYKEALYPVRDVLKVLHHFEQVAPKGDLFFYLQTLKLVRLERSQKAPVFINNPTHHLKRA